MSNVLTGRISITITRVYFILSRNRNIKKRRLNVILPEWKTKQAKGDLMDLDI